MDINEKSEADISVFDLSKLGKLILNHFLESQKIHLSTDTC